MKYLVVKCLNQRCSHEFLTTDLFADETTNCPRCNSEQIKVQSPEPDPNYQPMSKGPKGSAQTQHIDNTLKIAQTAFGASDFSNKGGTASLKQEVSKVQESAMGHQFKTKYGNLQAGWSGVREGSTRQFQARG